jgi:myo-inositol 2-dehydrogenase / D-chiro-inositol 1-dehydrogenase
MKPETTRRKFLSAAGVFSIVAPQSVRGSQANSQVAVGLIGCGGRGSFDGSIVQADPRARVMALCDKFPDQFDKSESTIKSQNTRKYTEFEKMLSAPDIDAVFIATPPFEHPRMLEAAIQAKKHVYCEKPIGVDVEGVKRVLAANKKADKSKTIFVGFQQRHGPEYLEAFKRIKNGDIGELANARAFWISNDPFTRKPYDPSVEKLRNWFCYKEYSGDIIVEQDCHNLDVLHWFLGGLPLSAVGRGNKKVRKNMDILDNLTVIYQWPDGMFVNFEANQLTPRGFNKVGEEFTGTKGTIATSRARMTHYKGPRDTEDMPTKRDITNDAIEAFVTRIVNNQPENMVDQSALSTCIALLGRAAIYTGRETTWKGDIGI